MAKQKKEKAINDLKNKINDPKCINFVKRVLEGYANLPVEGIIAGQSVSSAIIEYLKMDNKINPVYNDIDVFHYIPNISEYERVGSKGKVNQVSASSGYAVSTERSGYEMIIRKSFTMSEVMIESLRDGMINNTFYGALTITNRENSFGERLIDHFDINSTQVAIDPKTQKIIYTDSFIDFLYTKELNIVKFDTPLHSIIRLHKKKKELGEVFSDIEKNQLFAFSAGMFSSGVKDFREEMDMKWRYGLGSLTPIHFGEKMKETFESLSLEDAGLIIETKKTKREYTEREKIISEIGGGKITDYTYHKKEIEIDLHTLSIPSSIGQDFYNFASKNNAIDIAGGKRFDSFMEIATRTRGSNTKDMDNYQEDYYWLSKTVDIAKKAEGTKKAMVPIIKEISKKIVDDSEKRKYGNKFIEEALYTTFFYDGIRKADITELLDENIDTVKKVQSLVKFFREHNLEELQEVLWQKNLSAQDRIDIVEMIIKASKEDKIVIGLLENDFLYNEGVRILKKAENDKQARVGWEKHAIDLLKDPELFKSRIKAVEEEYSTVEVDKKIQIETENYHVDQLVSYRDLIIEGSTMSHCVAGYIQSVSKGNSIIIGLRNKNKKRTSSVTVELGKKRKDRSMDMQDVFSWVDQDQEEDSFYISQAYSAFNKKVPLTLELIEIFKKIEEVFPFIETMVSRMFSNEKEAEEMINKIKEEEHNEKFLNKEWDRNKNIPIEILPGGAFFTRIPSLLAEIATKTDGRTSFNHIEKDVSMEINLAEIPF